MPDPENAAAPSSASADPSASAAAENTPPVTITQEPASPVEPMADPVPEPQVEPEAPPPPAEASGDNQDFREYLRRNLDWLRKEMDLAHLGRDADARELENPVARL